MDADREGVRAALLRQRQPAIRDAGGRAVRVERLRTVPLAGVGAPAPHPGRSATDPLPRGEREELHECRRARLPHPRAGKAPELRDQSVEPPSFLPAPEAELAELAGRVRRLSIERGDGHAFFAERGRIAGRLDELARRLPHGGTRRDVEALAGRCRRLVLLTRYPGRFHEDKSELAAALAAAAIEAS